MLWITTDSHGGRPLTSRMFFLFGLIKVLLNSFLLTLALIPAFVYVYAVIYFWPILNAEGAYALASRYWVGRLIWIGITLVANPYTK